MAAFMLHRFRVMRCTAHPDNADSNTVWEWRHLSRNAAPVHILGCWTRRGWRCDSQGAGDQRDQTSA